MSAPIKQSAGGVPIFHMVKYEVTSNITSTIIDTPLTLEGGATMHPDRSFLVPMMGGQRRMATVHDDPNDNVEGIQIIKQSVTQVRVTFWVDDLEIGEDVYFPFIEFPTTKKVYNHEHDVIITNSSLVTPTNVAGFTPGDGSGQYNENSPVIWGAGGGPIHRTDGNEDMNSYSLESFIKADGSFDIRSETPGNDATDPYKLLFQVMPI